MTQLAATRNSHQTNFSRLGQEAVTMIQPWLQTLRNAAMDRFDLVGFPGRKEEEWRFTNVDPISKTHFNLAAPATNATDIEAATAFSFGRSAMTELVFINGHYV